MKTIIDYWTLKSKKESAQNVIEVNSREYIIDGVEYEIKSQREQIYEGYVAKGGQLSYNMYFFG